jgi:MoaA/NifB/PqqE/SkfB family radical SAM enzyme
MHRLIREVAACDVPVLKLSGGEIFLVRGMDDLIAYASAHYETVVLLTNGSLLTAERLRRFEQLGNIVLQLSLDATRYPGNSYRVGSPQVHDSIMTRVRSALETDLAIEIYVVLNDRSIETLGETLDDLRAMAGEVTVFPFPVRGPSRLRFLPRPEQHARLREVIDRAAEYGALLPGPAYLNRLWRFFHDGERRFRCHLPRVAFTAFDDGTATTCPNIWFNHVGNLLEELPARTLERLHDAPFKKLLLAPHPRVDACRGCFTPWDPISSFFDEGLALDELARIPIYRGPRALARLNDLRDVWLAEQSDA